MFAHSVKRHTCHVKNSGLEHAFPISVNDRVISPFREGFFSRNFESEKFCENKTLAKILSEFKVLNKRALGSSELKTQVVLFLI